MSNDLEELRLHDVQSPLEISLSKSSTPYSGHSSSRLLFTTPKSRLSKSSQSNIRLDSVAQIARDPRKSVVLSEKMALSILAIPDRDEYNIEAPYSCRSNINPAKFVGKTNFITHCQPQDVLAFKKEYSRNFGNLNRHHSVTAGPIVASIGNRRSFLKSGINEMTCSSNQHSSDLSDKKALWKYIRSNANNSYWMLTENGAQELIGKEYKITTRVCIQSQGDIQVQTQLPTPNFLPSSRDRTNSSFRECESAKIGLGVDLDDEKTLLELARTAFFPLTTRTTSIKSGNWTNSSPQRLHNSRVISPGSPSLFTTRDLNSAGYSLTISNNESNDLISPYVEITKSERKNIDQDFYCTRLEESTPESIQSKALTPTLQPFSIELSPLIIDLRDIYRQELYMFPIRIRNVGWRQERFRIGNITAYSGKHVDATIANVNCDKRTGRLAPGLASIVTVFLKFQAPGDIAGTIKIETEDIGSYELKIIGVVV